MHSVRVLVQFGGPGTPAYVPRRRHGQQIGVGYGTEAHRLRERGARVEQQPNEGQAFVLEVRTHSAINIYVDDPDMLRGQAEPCAQRTQACRALQWPCSCPAWEPPAGPV